MPQPLNDQKGSILVGVIGLSLAMTILAGGFLTQTYMVSRDMENATKDIVLHYAAESGSLMGVRWLRTHTPTIDYTFTGPLVITQTWITLERHSTKVTVLGTNVPPFTPLRTILDSTTKGPHQDTLVITWEMKDPPGPDASGITFCQPIMSNWQEKILPGR